MRGPQNGDYALNHWKHFFESLQPTTQERPKYSQVQQNALDAEEKNVGIPSNWCNYVSLTLLILKLIIGKRTSMSTTKAFDRQSFIKYLETQAPEVAAHVLARMDGETASEVVAHLPQQLSGRLYEHLQALVPKRPQALARRARGMAPWASA